MLLVRLRYSCSGPRSLLSVVYLFLSLTGGTPRRLVRHHRSGVQKKQDDTRQSSNGLQSRSPPTNVITELQISLDLRKLILTGNNPDGPASCYCKFLVVFSLPVSSAVRCRVLCRKTIGVVSNYTDDGIDRSLFIYCDSDRFLQRESKLIEKMA